TRSGHAPQRSVCGSPHRMPGPGARSRLSPCYHDRAQVRMIMAKAGAVQSIRSERLALLVRCVLTSIAMLLAVPAARAQSACYEPESLLYGSVAGDGSAVAIADLDLDGILDVAVALPDN